MRKRLLLVFAAALASVAAFAAQWNAAGDTLTLTEADLPYTYTGKIGEQKVVALPYSSSPAGLYINFQTEGVVNEDMEFVNLIDDSGTEYPLYTGFGLQACGLGGQVYVCQAPVAKQVNRGKAFTLTIATAENLLANIATAENVTTTPISEAGVLVSNGTMPAKLLYAPYYTWYAGELLAGAMPVVASYEITPDGANCYELICKGGARVAARGASGITDVTYATTYSNQPTSTDKIILDVIAPTAGYSIEFRTGATSSINLFDMVDAKEITLPYRGTAQCTTHQASINESTTSDDYYTYDLYKFKVNENGTARLRYESNNDVLFSMVEEYGNSTSYRSLSNGGDKTLLSITPGEYYIALLGDAGAKADFSLSLEPENTKQVVLGDTAFLPGNRTITVSKTYYGQLVPHDTLFNSTDYFSNGPTHAIAHNLDVKEGTTYAITIAMNAGCSNEQNEVQWVILDSLNTPIYSNNSTDIIKNKLSVSATGYNCIPLEPGRYKVLVAGYVQLTPRDYTILVEPYSIVAAFGYQATMITIPFALDSTMLANENDGDGYSIHYFQINNIPTTDTTVVVKWKTNDKSLERIRLIGIVDGYYTKEREFEITTILDNEFSGVPITVFGIMAEGYGDYHLEMRYSDRKLSNTTAITLAELLAAAEQVNSLAEQRILLGAEPSKLVTGTSEFMNDGSRYYAQAYKVQVEAGQYIHATMSKFANGGAPAIRILKKDNAGNISGEAEGSYSANYVVTELNEGDEYYVVFTSEYTTERGNSLVSISVGQSATTSTITFAELLAGAEEVTIPATISKVVNFGSTESKYVQGETDLFGDDATAQYYAVAYKVTLPDSTALVTYPGDNRLWIYKYDESATTAVKVTQEYESYSSYKKTIYEAGTYYVVFSTDDIAQAEVNIATRAIVTKERLASVAIDITLPYTDSITFSNAIVVDDEVFASAEPLVGRVYKVSLTKGQSIANTSESELYLITDVENYDPDVTADLDYIELYSGSVEKIDSTGEYYLVVYYEEDQKFTVEAITAYTSEEIVELAEPLPGIRGKVQIEPSEFIAENFNNNLYWDKIYKVDLKKGVNFRMQASREDLETDVYQKQADGTLNKAWVYSNINYNYSDLYLVDEDATYYFLIYSREKPEEAVDFSWEISITPAEYIALASETATTLPAEITANIEEFVTPLVAFADDTIKYMDAQPQRLALKEGDLLAIIKNNNVYKTHAEKYNIQQTVVNLESDNTATTLANESEYDDAVSVVTAGAGKNYFIGQAYKVNNMSGRQGERTYMLHAVEQNIDSAMKLANVLSMNTLPMVDEGDYYDLIMNKCIWYTSDLTVVRTYQITLNKNEQVQIAFTDDEQSSIDYGIYRNGTFESSDKIESGSTASVNGTADGDVVTILLYPGVDLLSADYDEIIAAKDYNYNITISNPYQVTNVTALDVVDNIVVDDYTNEAEVRMALAELNVEATLQSGAMQNMAKYTTWTYDQGMTQAVGTVTLPAGYDFADGVESTVTLLINPATISTAVDGNGTITPAATKVVRRGTELTYTIAAAEGYEIKLLKANGSEIEEAVAKTEYTYTFTAKKSTKIEVVFVAKSTGIEQVAANDFTLYTHERTIVIEDAAMNAIVRIYSLTGNLIYAGHITATAEQYQMPTAGLYIVRVGNKVQKAIVK